MSNTPGRELSQEEPLTSAHSPPRVSSERGSAYTFWAGTLTELSRLAHASSEDNSFYDGHSLGP